MWFLVSHFSHLITVQLMQNLPTFFVEFEMAMILFKTHYSKEVVSYCLASYTLLYRHYIQHFEDTTIYQRQ